METQIQYHERMVKHHQGEVDRLKKEQRERSKHAKKTMGELTFDGTSRERLDRLNGLLKIWGFERGQVFRDRLVDGLSVKILNLTATQKDVVRKLCDEVFPNKHERPTGSYSGYFWADERYLFRVPQRYKYVRNRDANNRTGYQRITL